MIKLPLRRYFLEISRANRHFARNVENLPVKGSSAIIVVQPLDYSNVQSAGQIVRLGQDSVEDAAPDFEDQGYNELILYFNALFSQLFLISSRIFTK